MRTFLKYAGLVLAILLAGQIPFRGKAVGEHLVDGMRSGWRLVERKWRGSTLRAKIRGTKTAKLAYPEVSREPIRESRRSPASPALSPARGYHDTESGEKISKEDQERLRKLLAQ